MATTPPRPDHDEGDAMGEEPEIESGAGYGNHAPEPAGDDTPGE